MRINQNISAMNTYSRLTGANNSKSRSLEKLSSGLRINRAGDDAAGLAISEKMRGQVGGLKQAVRNAQDGISLIQTAEGALNETHSILGRMRDLAVQSSSDTNTDADRAEIQKEIDQLASEMTRISNTTEFNTKNLLNGQLGETVFHIGANSGQSIKLGIGAMDAKSLGLAADAKTPEVKKDDIAGAIIAGVDFGDISADDITAGDEITFEYVAEEAGSATATKGDSKISATETTFATFKTALGAAGTKTIEVDIDGKGPQTITLDDTVASFADLATDIETKLQALGTGYEDVAVAMSATGELTITSGTEGTASTVSITDKSGLFGVQTATGGKGTETIPAHVKLADGSTATISKDGKSFTIDKGEYKGMKITLADGAEIKDLLAANDKVTLSITTEEAKEAYLDEDGNLVKAEAPKGIDVSTQTAADAAITAIDKATAQVSEERSKLGSVQNRLDHTINNLTATAENLSAAESRIRDVDMAEEMMEFTKNNILSQAATSMLAQANQMPQSVLQLLQ